MEVLKQKTIHYQLSFLLGCFMKFRETHHLLTHLVCVSIDSSFTSFCSSTTGLSQRDAGRGRCDSWRTMHLRFWRVIKCSWEKKKLEIQYNTIHIISYNTTQDPIGNNTTRQGTQHFSNTHNPAPQNSAVWNLQRAHELIERLLKGRSDAGKQLGVVCIYIYTQYICHVISYILQVDFIFVYG